jgi:AraC-like DNA-binding protein
MYQLDSKRYWGASSLPIELEFRDPQNAFPLHVHDFYEIIIVLSGNALHLTATQNYKIQSRDIIIVKPGQAHGYKSIQNLVLMNVLVKPSFFTEDYFDILAVSGYVDLFGPGTGDGKDAGDIIHFRLDPDIFFKARTAIMQAAGEFKKKNEGYKVMFMALTLEFFMILLRAYKAMDDVKTEFTSDAVSLVNYVKENYRSPLTMKMLTGIFGMSESGVLRFFRQHLGCSPLQYIIMLRMTDAKEELVHTEKPVSQIASDLGFTNSNYFSRCFRKHLGISPHEYRNKYKQGKIFVPHDSLSSQD